MRKLSQDEIKTLISTGEIHQIEEIRKSGGKYVAPGRRFEPGSAMDRRTK